jgi:beta-lactamase regulating signal transducer with metallopeptidase domain
MSSFLFYILKSSIGISLLYGAFRLFMRKETFFALNRAILLAIVLVSTAIPLVSLPPIFPPIVLESRNSAVQQLEINPIVSSDFAQPENATTETISTQRPLSKSHFSWATLIQYSYWGGVLIAFLILIHGVGSVLVLFRNAKLERADGYKLVIVDHEVSPFSFAKIIVISRVDYENHRQSIFTHEQAHIRLNHFFDLVLLEVIKIAHWFNPFIYLLIKDMKEIHEFQADEYTLNTGIDAKQYQFLIIQKSVGKQRFALANSFNHCQIKNRIIMMNKSKTSKAWRWKVATFLPLLALLLMAFSKTGGNVSEKENVPIKIMADSGIKQNQNEQTNLSIEIKKDGNYIDNKLCSLEEIVKRAKAWQKTNEEILLLVDSSIPYVRIDEVRETLEKANIYFINQSSSISDEIIYPAGDVTEMAKFTQGKWEEWMNNQLKNIDEGKKYKITYSFIIDKNGKIKDGHIIKASEYPEINAAMEKILTKIPDWNPAKKGGIAVNVLYKEINIKN